MNHQHKAHAARLLLATALLQAMAPLYANPIAPTVTSGSATFNQSGSTLTVTNSNNTVINWQAFSIGTGETTVFNQASSSSQVLNRVTGVDPSVILGTLQSNGRVYLINPNGIAFGAGAQVNVGGLVASTLNLSDADFLAGKLNFTATPGAGNINNQANLNASGDIILVAPNIQNSGIIQSTGGQVLLAAGNTVNIVDSNNPDISFEVTAPANQAVNLGQIIAHKVGIFAAGITNNGSINADSATIGSNGQIILKARDNLTTGTTSSISANGTNGANGGNITLQTTNGTTQVQGSISANGDTLPSPTGGGAGGGGTGGNIQILGTQVGLLDGANISANGATGGGTVLVGGDAHGINAAVQNSTNTYVAPTASISADATQNGNGGKVVVWSNNATQFGGNISAQGGAQSGNGGWVEVSGKQWLGYAGLVNTTAAHGTIGSLLLDPTDITISTAASTATMTWTAGTTTFGDASTTPSNLNVTTLQNQLALSNVTVDTTSTLLGVGNITVQSSIAWASANSLTLKATGAGSITVNALDLAGAALTIANTGTGGLTMTTAGAGGGGNLTTNGAITLAGGSFTAQAGGTGSIALNAAVNTGATGNVYLSAAGGTITSAAAATITANNLQLISSGNITLNSTNAVSNVAANATGATSTILLQNANTNLTVGAITSALGTTTGVTANAGATIWQYTAGNVSINNNFNAGTGQAKIGIASGTGALTVAAGAAVSGVGINPYTSGGAITINGSLIDTGAGGIALGSPSPFAGVITEGVAGVISTAGLLTVNSAGGATLTGANTVGSFNATNTTSGNVALNNTAATLTVTGISNTVGTTAVNNAGAISITGTIQAGARAINLTATGATGSIAESGAGTIITAGLLTTSSTAGQTLNNAANIVSSFNATNTTSGNVAFTSSGTTLNVTGISNTVGTTTVNNSASINITGTIAAGAGAINMAALAIFESGAGAISTTGLLTTLSQQGQTLSGANTVGSFNATNTLISGNIALTNTAATLNVTGISNTVGTIAVTNAGAINITGAIAAGANAINLTATGATGSITESGAGAISTTGLLTTTGTGTTLSGTNSLGSLTALTSLSVAGGTTTVSGAFTSPIVNILGGTLNLNNAAGTTLTALNLSSGTLGGTGGMTISTAGTFMWTGGTLANTGGLTNFGTTLISGVLALNGGFTNNATLNQDIAPLTLNIGAGGSLINNGIFTLGNAAQVAAGTINVSDSGLFINGTAGILNSTGAFTNTIQAMLGASTFGTTNNNGAVNIASGNTLNWIAGQTTTNAGGFTTATGGVLNIGSALATATNSYSGIFANSGITNFAGGTNSLTNATSITGTGAVNFTGGSSNVTGSVAAATLTNSGTANTTLAGNATVSGAVSNGATLNVSGSLTANGLLTNGGTLNLLGGTVNAMAGLTNLGIINLGDPSLANGADTLNVTGPWDNSLGFINSSGIQGSRALTAASLSLTSNSGYIYVGYGTTINGIFFPAITIFPLAPPPAVQTVITQNQTLTSVPPSLTNDPLVTVLGMLPPEEYVGYDPFKPKTNACN